MPSRTDPRCRRLRLAELCGDDPDLHAFETIGSLHAIIDVPAAVSCEIVLRNVVAHQNQDHQHRIFGGADRIGERDLRDRDAVFGGGDEIDMVGTDARPR